MGRGVGFARVAVVVIALFLLSASVAVAAGSEQAEGGRAVLKVKGSVSPAVASAPRQTAVRLGLVGNVTDPGAEEEHPPALREAILESADLEIHTRGIPACRLGQLQATETRTALKECGPALIGSGTEVAQVRFPEQKPIEVHSKLLLFNGGTEGGKTKLFAHTYFPNPISGAIVTTIGATSLKGGSLGTFAVVKVPQITGGSGSIIGFNLTIDRKVGDRNPVSASCEEGRVRAYLVGKFEDGTRTTSEVVSPCTGGRS